MKELNASGELIGGQALADASSTKTVRVRGGVPVITDGPLAEAKEQLGGYLIVDCDSVERATEIAARAEDTDWPQIPTLYELLERIAPNPMVALNRVVAVAMVRGPTVRIGASETT